MGPGTRPYDDAYFTTARALDIDRLIPLAEAWDSDASAWTLKEREVCANDLEDARALIAVSFASNRSKADQDPTSRRLGGRQTRWLTIDPVEQTALADILDNARTAPSK
ncbi:MULTISPECIES: hypothetical protein [Streptomyces]|uniref:hypothetical protein n=1 Tax=Streptomyces TaxID=1883 RepID=UPI000A8AA63C|nr:MULTISPECIES: hypothetical protein [Streptomyces]MDI5911588.1 hypothetical protein [Streptomyces sp. 12257]